VSDSVRLPPRHPVHPHIKLSPAEKQLYAETVKLLRDLYKHGFHEPSAVEVEEDRRRRSRRTGRGIFILELTRLCQRLCSSSRSLAASLKKLAEGELVLPEFRTRIRALADQAAAVTTHAKLDLLAQALDKADDRMVIFSEHRPTLKLIAERVRESGRRPILFHGSMSRPERTRSLARFKSDEASVFVATRAGTEGLNLQFCNKLVNYELPWNPMVVEQRIGRIHRIGQERESFIINLAAAGTVEQRVLHLLDEKIRLFELVVGELDVILGDFGGADTLERRLVDDWLEADSDAAFDERIEVLGAEIDRSRESGKEQEELNSRMVADDGAMRLDREFTALTVPGRLRLGYGTRHVNLAPGVEAIRHQIGLHVNEILEMLSSGPVVEDAGMHPEYGPLQRVIGVTGRGRAITIVVQADRLPMTLVELEADAQSPRVA
jgi:superfamily II DNA or RNA helicase